MRCRMVSDPKCRVFVLNFPQKCSRSPETIDRPRLTPDKKCDPTTIEFSSVKTTCSRPGRIILVNSLVFLNRKKWVQFRLTAYVLAPAHNRSSLETQLHTLTNFLVQGIQWYHAPAIICDQPIHLPLCKIYLHQNGWATWLVQWQLVPSSGYRWERERRCIFGKQQRVGKVFFIDTK